MVKCTVCEDGELFVPIEKEKRIDLHCDNCGEIYIPAHLIREHMQIIKDCVSDVEFLISLSEQDEMGNIDV